MKASPPVTIILPVYNGERTIAAAIESVLAQTRPDWELRIVNDGSVDTTAASVARFDADPRLHVISQMNAGLSAARNRGLADAHSPYIAFLDADDVWRPAYLARMIAALETAPQAAAALAGWQYMDANGGVLPQTTVVQPQQVERLRENLTWRNSMLPSSVVVRQAAITKSGGFDLAVPICSDWDLWLRLRPLGDFVAVPEVLVLYRADSHSMSENVENMERGRFYVQNKHLGTTPADPKAWSAEQRRAAGYTYFLSALAYFRGSQLAAGSSKIRAAVEVWPELLSEDEFYFELGCAFQPRGYRGSPIGLDVRASGELIRSLLFDGLSLPAPAARARWAHACLVLAQLGFIAGDRPRARAFALRAILRGSAQQKWRAARRLVRATLPTAWTTAWRAQPARRLAPAERKN